MSQNSSVKSAQLNYEHYCCFPDDGRRHEIIDGDHLVNPAPGTYHQTVSKRLQYQLYTQFELAGLGLVFNAPVDVQLTEHDIVQPDLVVVLHADRTIITPTKIKGSPNLIVEILSPATRTNDQTLKRQLYEKTGVREYWIADPFEHALDQLVLVDGVYETQPATDDVCPSIATDVIVRLQDVW